MTGGGVSKRNMRPDAGKGIEKPDSAVVKPRQKEWSNAAFGNENGVTEFSKTTRYVTRYWKK